MGCLRALSACLAPTNHLSPVVLASSSRKRLPTSNDDDGSFNASSEASDASTVVTAHTDLGAQGKLLPPRKEASPRTTAHMPLGSSRLHGHRTDASAAHAFLRCATSVSAAAPCSARPTSRRPSLTEAAASIPSPHRLPSPKSTSRRAWPKSESPTVARVKQKCRLVERQQRQKLVTRNTGRELSEAGYDVLGPIAAGAFSTVLRARHRQSGTEVAVKTFTGHSQSGSHRELSVLRLLQRPGHESIANMLTEHESQHASHAILHYCSGGSLQRHLGKLRSKRLGLPESEAAHVAAQISSAMNYLHNRGIAHRDIKPGNVVLDSIESDGHGRWRLCDFGFAIVCGDRLIKKAVGTPTYLAPELVQGQWYVGRFVDMWAFGAMLYEMLEGRPAFIAEGIDDLKLRIRNGFHSTFSTSLTKPAKQLVLSLLVNSPMNRFSASEVMNSDWIRRWCCEHSHHTEMSAIASMHLPHPAAYQGSGLNQLDGVPIIQSETA